MRKNASPIATIAQRFLGHRLVAAVDSFDIGLRQAILNWDLGTLAESQDMFVLGSDNAYVRCSSLTAEDRASLRGITPEVDGGATTMPSVDGYHHTTLQFTASFPLSFYRDAQCTTAADGSDTPTQLLDDATSKLVLQRIADVVEEMRHTHAPLLHDNAIEQVLSVPAPIASCGRVWVPVTLAPDCVVEFQLELIPTSQRTGNGWLMSRHITLPGGAPVPMLPVPFPSQDALLDYFDMSTRLILLHRSRAQQRFAAQRGLRRNNDREGRGTAVGSLRGATVSTIDMS